MAYTAAKNGSGESGGFQLHCRGDVRLYCGDHDCTPRPKKGRALLAILAAEQRPLSRTKIIDLLWSDRQEEQARASLRTLLADLKEQFNSSFEDLLVVDRERVALGPGVRTDLTDPTLARPAGELFEGLDHIDPELDEWLRVERERWAASLNVVASENRGAKPPESPARAPTWVLVAMLLFALLAAAMVHFRPWESDRPPLIAVLKFKDLTGRNALLAAGLAEQLRLELAQQPRIGVIGSQSAESDQITTADTRTAVRLLGATHLVEGAIVPLHGSVRLNLRLIDGRSGKNVWSNHVEASGAGLTSGPDPIAYRIAIAIGEIATRAAPPEAMAADADAYAAVFKARAMMRTYDHVEQLKARELMYRVVSRHPNFVPALLTLAESTIANSDAPTMRGSIPIAQARAEALHYARRAMKLAPAYGPAYSAMGSVYFQMDEGIPFDRKAAQLSSGSGSARLNWALALQRMGNWRDALEENRIAARLDPLGLTAQFYYALALVENGRYSDAQSALQDYFRRSISPELRLQIIASANEALFGNLSEGYVASLAALKHDPADPWSRGLAMTATRRLYGVAAARRHADRQGSISEMIVHDDLRAVEARIAAMGREFWHSDYEIEAAGHYLLAKGRGEVLVSAYDRAVKSGMAADHDLFGSEELVIALRGRGRDRDAVRILRIAERTISRQRRQSYERLAFDRALVFALAGDKERALANVELAVRKLGWLYPDFADHPFNHFAFRGLRSDRRFRAAVRDYDAMIERERREAATEARKAGLGPPPLTPPPPARLS